ncbi:glutathione S-transferase family protein [Lysobacter sp. H21R4]|uniref:glutathione S-transferase family protein n=1 Tax=Lysobacter sp. H21R4 TaxID=2781021 RepID=UPI001886CC7F|nr:glutathione S-transferase family protein [Lysobacter sp. H21R4]QOY63714.1 glutathione S-transferase family protein [Lysobacter sp. H21R4]
MGLLVDGQWHDKWYDTGDTGGRFERSKSQFRNWITADGSAGPDGRDGFKAESGRYHLYVSYACPWAHRTLLMRAWKGLEQDIGVSVVHPLMLESGWELRTDFDGATGDPLYGFDKTYQLYLKADPHYSGRVTVPTLWDRQRETIVSNESADIIRMLNSAFDGVGAQPGDYYPADLRAEIDRINDTVYEHVNNGVYKAGFCTTQSAYDEAVSALFATLEDLEQRLGNSRYLVGNTLTEADLRLWTTLVRFDAVYVTHFKCDRKRIVDYPNLNGLLRDIYQMPGVAGTVHMDHIRHHYFRSHPTINPHGIVSIGPELDFTAPHDRERLGKREVRGT